MKRVVILLLLAVDCIFATEEPQYIKKIVGATDLQIGFGKDCYLFWKGVSGETKPGEFRCGTKEGDPMELIRADNGEYKFRSDRRHMYWLGQSGNVKPMEFRMAPGDTFWIKKQPDGLFAIGAHDCPLYWLGQTGDVKPAEFRCGEPIKDTFWIKGGNCTAKNIEPIADDENQATYDGDEIVGVAASGTCSKTATQVLILGRTDDVTEEVALELAQGNETNFELGASISVTGKVGLFGTGVETTATASIAIGGAKSYSSAETKGTSQGTSNSAGSETHYNTPGAAFVVGFTKRYIFDKSEVPAKVTVQCENGYEYKVDTKIKLRSKVFGSTFFSTDAVQFQKGKCKEEYLTCMNAKNFKNYKEVTKAKEAFKECFPADALVEEKKKGKKHKAKIGRKLSKD